MSLLIETLAPLQVIGTPNYSKHLPYIKRLVFQIDSTFLNGLNDTFDDRELQFYKCKCRECTIPCPESACSVVEQTGSLL